MIIQGPKGLNEFVAKCISTLIVESPIQFLYLKGCNLTNWPVDEIKWLNNKVLKSLKGAGNVYVLYTRPS